MMMHASFKLSDDAYEELILPVLDRIDVPLQRALAESGLTIELLGGSTCIPAVRAALAGKP